MQFSYCPNQPSYFHFTSVFVPISNCICPIFLKSLALWLNLHRVKFSYCPNQPSSNHNYFHIASVFHNETSLDLLKDKDKYKVSEPTQLKPSQLIPFYICFSQLSKKFETSCSNKHRMNVLYGMLRKCPLSKISDRSVVYTEQFFTIKAIKHFYAGTRFVQHISF